MVFKALEADPTLHKLTLQKSRANNYYPKDIRSFRDDGPLPVVKTGLQLLLHQYDVTRIMQPTTHSCLRHKQDEHVGCLSDKQRLMTSYCASEHCEWAEELNQEITG